MKEKSENLLHWIFLRLIAMCRPVEKSQNPRILFRETLRLSSVGKVSFGQKSLILRLL